MTKEEAKERFGDNIINKLLLGFDTVRETVFGMEKELSIDESVNVKFDYEII